MKTRLLLSVVLLLSGFSTQVFGQFFNDDSSQGGNHWNWTEPQSKEQAAVSTLTVEQWKSALLGGTITICKNQPIPSGYVIVGAIDVFEDCPYLLSTNDAWIIKLPGAIETICKDSPIPSGYVIVGTIGVFDDCPYHLSSNDAWRIKRLPNPSASPTGGLWYNPNRSGHGIDISRSSTGQLILYWYTYLPNGQPIWFTSDLASMSQGAWVATLNKVTRDPTSGNVVQQPVGTAELTMSANNELLFEWSLNSQSGSPSSGAEEMIHLTGGSSYTGLWYEPTFSGWGITLDVQGNGASASNAATAYFYTASGQPVWAQGVATGDVNSSSGVTFNMQAFVGTNLCPGCTGQPSTTPSSAGTLNMRQLGSSPRGYSNIQTTSGVTWVRGSPSNLITYARLTLP